MMLAVWGIIGRVCSTHCMQMQCMYWSCRIRITSRDTFCCVAAVCRGGNADNCHEICKLIYNG